MNLSNCHINPVAHITHSQHITFKADTGASKNYVRTVYSSILTGIKTKSDSFVTLPNEQVIQSTKEGNLPIVTTKKAKTALILPQLTNSSLGDCKIKWAHFYVNVSIFLQKFIAHLVPKKLVLPFQFNIHIHQSIYYKIQGSRFENFLFFAIIPFETKRKLYHKLVNDLFVRKYMKNTMTDRNFDHTFLKRY